MGDLERVGAPDGGAGGVCAAGGGGAAVRVCGANGRALDAIGRFAPIVELGAGTGYWAYLLAARGVDIVAYDLAPPDQVPNAYKLDPRTWTTVRPGGVEILSEHPDRPLFLCWPGYRDAFANDALAAYAGQHVLYIGEDRGGNTANPAFFDQLGDELVAR